MLLNIKCLILNKLQIVKDALKLELNQMCVPEDVLCVQIHMQPVDEQGWIPRLQAQSPFEKLQRRER